jgi:hypothetical protein
VTKSDLLFRILSDRAPALAALGLDYAPPDPLPHADPYLLASAMQKAIRRGDSGVARRAGHQLLTLDRSRLWRRLMVVALEDIGIADPDAAAELITISTLTAARRLLGGDAHALDIALARACAAVKDRSGDHLASIIGREPVENMDRVAIRTASPNALLAMVAASDLPWERRLRAAVAASGRTDNAMRSRAPGVRAVLDVLHELGVSSLLLVACEAYAARSRDPLPVFVPFAAMLHGNANAPACSRAVESVSHVLPPTETIAGWPAYTFDPVNTRLGRRAVDLWLRSYIAKPQWLPRQVAALLWNSESALCDHTLSWPFGDQIRERAYTADLTFRGLPLARHSELSAWIERERPVLTSAREAAFASAVRASAKPVEASEQAYLPLLVPGGPQRRG